MPRNLSPRSFHPAKKQHELSSDIVLSQELEPIYATLPREHLPLTNANVGEGGLGYAAARYLWASQFQIGDAHAS